MFRALEAERARHYLYHFSAQPASREIQALVEQYITTSGATAVVYESDRREWFGNLLQAACAARRIPCFSMVDVRGKGPAENDDDIHNSRLQEHAREVLSSADARICVAFRLLRTGRHARKILKELDGLVQGTLRPLTLLVAKALEGNDQLRDGFHTRSIPLGGERRPLDYFLEVDDHSIAEDSWQVRSAEILGEVEDPQTSWLAPTRVALWALFEELGAEPETPAPPGRARPRAFPALRNLGPLDASWLAESAVRVAERDLTKAAGREVPRAEILVVAPDEPSGARPIADALAKLFDVASTAIPRPVFERTQAAPDRLLRRLRNYRDFSIVLFDESTLSYSTLASLERFLLDVIDRRADLCVSVIESPLPSARERPSTLTSLYSWIPIRLVQS